MPIVCFQRSVAKKKYEVKYIYYIPSEEYKRVDTPFLCISTTVGTLTCDCLDPVVSFGTEVLIQRG